MEFDPKNHPDREQIESYVTQRLRGAGGKLKAAEARVAELEEALAGATGSVDAGAAAAEELVRTNSTIEEALESLAGQLSPQARAAIPASLPAGEKLAWVITNRALLEGTGPRQVIDIKGGGGRGFTSQRSAIDEASAAINAAISRRKAGGR